MDYLATMHKMNIAGTGYGMSCMYFLYASLKPSFAVSIHTVDVLNGCLHIVGSYFVLAMLDKLWHGSLTEAEALNLQLKGVEEVKRRLVVAPPDFIIKVSPVLQLLQ